MANYPSKILLFGEYTIIKNSAALAIPYPHYKSYWSDSSDIPQDFQNTITATNSRQSLQKILSDIKKLALPVLNTTQLAKDLQEGLWLCSNSPMGYGLGSSGAVCAAIYDRYALNKNTNLQVLKKELAILEQSFHGKSSGIDPLIAYCRQALWVQPNQPIVPIQLPKENTPVIFLLDSQLPRVSSPLIQFFVQQCQDPNFLSNFVHPISQAVDLAIEALSKNQIHQLMPAVETISHLQFEYLAPMIPNSIHTIWKKGLDSQQFYLKLCGAGGGGFMLGFAYDWSSIATHFDKFPIQQIF